MGITIRLWSKEELEKAEKDEWLATLLMNKTTFNKEEMRAYYRISFSKRTFRCSWQDYSGNDENEVTIHAPNEKMLKRFIEAEFVSLPDVIIEPIVRYVAIEI